MYMRGAEIGVDNENDLYDRFTLNVEYNTHICTIIYRQILPEKCV